jgi:hypothetical protein
MNTFNKYHRNEAFVHNFVHVYFLSFCYCCNHSPEFQTAAVVERQYSIPSASLHEQWFAVNNVLVLFPFLSPFWRARSLSSINTPRERNLDMTFTVLWVIINVAYIQLQFNSTMETGHGCCTDDIIHEKNVPPGPECLIGFSVRRCVSCWINIDCID